MAAGAKPWWVVIGSSSATGSATLPAWLYEAATAADADAAATKDGHTGITATEGPFTTKAQAQTAANGITQGEAPGPGVGAVEGAASSAVSGISSAVSGISEVGHFLGKLVTDVTDGAMWRSIGWILLGLVLIVIGMVMWAGKSGANPVPIPVPV